MFFIRVSGTVSIATSSSPPSGSGASSTAMANARDLLDVKATGVPTKADVETNMPMNVKTENFMLTKTNLAMSDSGSVKYS